MKKLFFIFLAFILAGCVTVKTQNYIQAKSPYYRIYFTSYENTYNATVKALKDLGWTISDITNPTVYEQKSVESQAPKQQILLLTEVRQTPYFVTSRYMNLNVYIFKTDDGAEVEIRYASVMPILFWNMEGYKNDAVVQKVFKRISDTIDQQ